MTSFSILAAATERPSAVALISSGEVLSFADLASRTKQVMSWLQQQLSDSPLTPRVSPTACVGVIATTEPWTVTLLHALMELSIPFALLHPRLPRAERDALCHRFPIVRVFEAGWHRELEPNETTSPIPSHAESALCIAFTGGTSGFPKACVLSRRALEHAVTASAANFGWQEDDRWQLCLSLAHLGGFSIVLRCLAARRTLVLTPPKSAHGGIDLDRVVHDLAEHRVTLISLVPTLLQRWLERSDLAVPARLRAILIGGDGVSPQTLQLARQRQFPVFTSYGLTEMASQVATQRYSLGPLMDAGNGPALPGVTLALDTKGRILVRGPSLFSGYWNPPNLELPLIADGWFCTHDHGRIDSTGCLHVLGRDSDLIVSGGENVYPAEVERIIQAHPAIEQCCVFAIPDATWGSVVGALLVGPKTISADLTAFLAQHLMPQQRPRRVAVVTELPQTTLGKIDRKAAAQDYLSQLLSLDYH